MSQTTSTRRNLLVITTDQERWFPVDPAPLPAHDRLRSSGTSFDRFYAASMACTSARSVMYTGQHVTTTGMLDNVGLPGQSSMRTDLPTLGTILRDHGYVTAYKGKWHLSTEALAPGFGPALQGPRADGPLPDALEPYGFGDYNDDGDDLGGPYEGFDHDDHVARAAIDWLSGTGRALAEQTTPWCLSVNLVNPHDIMFGTTDESVLDRNRVAEHRAFVGPPDTPLYRVTWDLPDDPTWGTAPTDPGRPSAHLDFAIANQIFTGLAAADDEQLRAFRNYYVNCLRDVDRAVGRVLAALDAAGLAEHTVIAYTSDHGELAGAHGLFGKGPCAYDENLRIPLILVDPSTPGGRRTNVIGSQLDLVPTLVSLATGVAPDVADPLPGHDLSPAVYGEPTTRDAALFAYDGLTFLDGAWARDTRVGMRTSDQVSGRDLTKRGLMRTLITGRYKFSRYFSPGEHHVPESVADLLERNTLELFDLDVDPAEQNNLAFDPDLAVLSTIEALGTELNALIAAEIGDDDGHWLPNFPGAPWTRPGDMA